MFSYGADRQSDTADREVSPSLVSCECGSALDSRRCCALDPGWRAGPDAVRAAAILAVRAGQAWTRGNGEEAEGFSLAALDLLPSQPEALWILCSIRRTAGKQRAAAALLERLVGFEPNHLEATHELATLLFEKGDYAAAERHARNAVRLAPTHPRSHSILGMVLTEAQRPHTGEFHYRRALALSDSRNPIILANLAWNLKNQGRIAEARELYRESVTAAPDVFQTWLGWGQLEEVQGNFAAACEKLDRAAAIRPDAPELCVARGTLLARQGQYAAALAALGEAAGSQQNGADPSGADPNALLEKGRILDRLGRYAEAFAAFEVAKARAREITGKTYLERDAQTMARRLTQFFERDRLRLMPAASVRRDVAQPIFVLGFPRSGTTLVEQALSNHPRISAGDELPFVGDLTEAIPRLFNSPLAYPEALAELWMGDNQLGLETLRDSYLQKAALRGLAGPSPWFTDKMPLNEMHLGLISLMFPQSPLIHVVRHPLDVVVSAYSHHMTHGYSCAYELEAIARHYRLSMDLVDHYRSQMPLRYLAVRYESLVGDFEGGIRRMLDFIGEPFDERCASFHQSPRLPQTPSYSQVSEKLYDRSLNR
jgi:Flp pilus assembly protein TadD